MKPPSTSQRTNPADVLAYFLTFTTYGTWLHGDERLSVGRRQNVPGTPRFNPSEEWRRQAQAKMTGSPRIFTAAQRAICTKAIQHLCTRRQWKLRALNVRTNHVHAVVTAPILGERVMADMKAFATKALRQQGEVAQDANVWSHHGSTQLLFDPQAVMDACVYVVEKQGAQQGVAGRLDE